MRLILWLIAVLVLCASTADAQYNLTGLPGCAKLCFSDAIVLVECNDTQPFSGAPTCLCSAQVEDLAKTCWQSCCSRVEDIQSIYEWYYPACGGDADPFRQPTLSRSSSAFRPVLTVIPLTSVTLPNTDWTLTPVNISVVPTSTSTIATTAGANSTTASSSEAPGTSSVAVPPQSIATNSIDGLSKGSHAGIGVAIGMIVLILVVLAGSLLWRRKRRRLRNNHLSQSTGIMEHANQGPFYDGKTELDGLMRSRKVQEKGELGADPVRPPVELSTGSEAARPVSELEAGGGWHIYTAN
jgi:hypothetical protein